MWSLMPCEKKLQCKSNETTPEKKMPLLTLDPNKPKLTPVSIRSPHKRSTPPQSPPTPHKIELIEECHQQQRKLRSSQSISSDSGSSTASSSSDEILQGKKTKPWKGLKLAFKILLFQFLRQMGPLSAMAKFQRPLGQVRGNWQKTAREAWKWQSFCQKKRTTTK